MGTSNFTYTAPVKKLTNTGCRPVKLLGHLAKTNALLPWRGTSKDLNQFAERQVTEFSKCNY